jgi:hypothetical protein
MSRAEAIRHLTAEQGQVYLSELHRALGAVTAVEKERVRETVRDLVRAGTLCRVSLGLYEWCGDKRRGRPKAKLGELWRLMRFARQFTKEDMRYRSGATLDYIKRCLSSWRAQGLIRLVGYRKKGQTREAVYRVITDQVAAPPLLRQRSQAGKPVAEGR